MQNTVSAASGPSETDDVDAVGAEVLVSVATLITEGRIAADPCSNKAKKFFEGPHCKLAKGAIDRGHECDLANSLCLKFENDRETVLNLCRKEIALCIEVLLTCQCKEIDDRSDDIDDIYVLEQWHLHIDKKKSTEPSFFNVDQLANAIRSQLYFSQITAWLTTRDITTSAVTPNNFRYHLTAAGEALASTRFHADADLHEFPATDIGDRRSLRVSCASLPRTSSVPEVECKSCAKGKVHDAVKKPGLINEMCRGLVDDRMHTCCTVKGKHRCEEEDEHVKSDSKANATKRLCQYAKARQGSSSGVYIENSSVYKSSAVDLLHVKNDLNKDKGQLLLDAIERSGKSTKSSASKDESDNKCDKRASDIFSIRKPNFSIYADKHCDSPIPTSKHKKIKDVSNIDAPSSKRTALRQKISFDEEAVDKSRGDAAVVDVPSPSEQAKFRKSLDNAASMVFHARTGLPLTSSPAPVRRGKSCFDFDSSITSVSAIKSALFSTSFSTDDDSESDGSVVSPCSPESVPILSGGDARHPVKYRRKGHATGLLGSFEESVLNGRLEPVSTVHGFTAELGASGSFVPKHLVVPVTVFFYTLGDNDKVASPYLSHINLGKKGYNVPKSGTVQVTLFNPLGTVVKMFVIMYDLSDMPPHSQTFLRQRTLYMPANCKDSNLEWGPKWLRYLIHLRFVSSKSGKIYLHSDVRMIIFRKSDMDTATGHGPDMSYELRSFTRMPANPRFSPRK